MTKLQALHLSVLACLAWCSGTRSWTRRTETLPECAKCAARRFKEPSASGATQPQLQHGGDGTETHLPPRAVPLLRHDRRLAGRAAERDGARRPTRRPRPGRPRLNCGHKNSDDVRTKWSKASATSTWSGAMPWEVRAQDRGLQRKVLRVPRVLRRKAGSYMRRELGTPPGRLGSGLARVGGELCSP